MRTPRAYGHLDADCFYVSAERVRDFFLLGKPVGVLGNQGACVIAKSYEMRAAGIKTGMPVWEALRLCPKGVYVKRDFRWYEVLSRQMLQVVQTRSHAVEYYSIDEFFFEAFCSEKRRIGSARRSCALARQSPDVVEPGR
jgi:nucleotidyltransferase/DNA polymerase involved in DNA repair